MDGLPRTDAYFIADQDRLRCVGLCLTVRLDAVRFIRRRYHSHPAPDVDSRADRGQRARRGVELQDAGGRNLQVLGTLGVEACFSFNGSGDGEVTIDELIGAVNHALNTCPGV